MMYWQWKRREEREGLRWAGKNVPVVVVVTGGGPRGVTVNFRVGNGDAVGGLSAEDNVLTANERGLLVLR